MEQSNKKLSLKEQFTKNAQWYVLGALFFANLFIWNAIFAESRSGILTVAFLDVGQGDAIFIEAPNGNQMLIDGGIGSVVLRQLGAVMPFYDKTIDIVMATHPDQDHISGLLDVLERYKVDFVMEPGAESETAVYKEFEKLIDEKQIKKILARRGMKLVLSDDAYILILFPDRDVSKMDTNDASIVAKLVYGETSFLFTGDSPQKIENFLTSIDGAALRSDVLKVGHHGSKTSSSDVFIGFVSPAISVISAGKDNRYGHPHSEVLERLTRFGSAIVRTDEAGVLIFKTDGNIIYTP